MRGNISTEWKGGKKQTQYLPMKEHQAKILSVFSRTQKRKSTSYSFLFL